MNQASGILEAFIQHEKSMSDLYKAYVEKSENLAEFWNGLSQEELQHADWIQRLLEKVQGEAAFLKKRTITIQAVSTSINFAKAQTERAKKERLSAIQMLSIALDIERAIIEKKFFDLFEGDSPEVKNTLSALAYETKNHIEKIQAMWMKYR